jgi:hypothetical protein
LSEQPLPKITATDEVTPKVREMSLRIAALMEGSNYQKLLAVMERHEAWQAWLDAMPVSSRILYQNQIPLHEDRGILLRMICGGSFGVEREKENLAIQNTIRLLNVKIEAITKEARDAVQE